MADAYDELLEATIDHLRQLKARGVRYVPVSVETLSGLAQFQRAPITKPATPPPAKPGFMTSPAPKPILPPSSMPDPVTATPLAAAALPVTRTKHDALEALRARVAQCTKCGHLAAARNSVVFGVGSPDAELMFVGEAPGADEDRQGEPFVGRAGQLLTKIIQAMGLARQNVYIANILKCRPDTPGQSSGNRAPLPEEMGACISYLHEQLDIIRPKVIVALGAVAVSGLLGKSGIARLRGTWHTCRDIPLMPTYHPSYLLRPENQAEKRKVWEDMMAVMERLRIPISEKQRGYFLK